MIKAILMDFNGVIIDDEPLRLQLAHAAQRRAIAENADVTAQLFEDCYATLTS